MNKQIPASELPLQGDGSIYHLNLHPHELADNVILVGDPGRVALISGMFDTVEMFKQNRELINKLRNQLRQSTVNGEQFRRVIDNLTRQMEDKDAQLKQMVIQMQEDVERMQCRR